MHTIDLCACFAMVLHFCTLLNLLFVFEFSSARPKREPTLWANQIRVRVEIIINKYIPLLAVSRMRALQFLWFPMSLSAYAIDFRAALSVMMSAISFFYFFFYFFWKGINALTIDAATVMSAYRG